MRPPRPLFVALVIATLVATASPSAGQENGYEVLGVHPHAARQPTSQGRAIITLAAWNGAIYTGYGDYTTNTGPIVIASLDPGTRRFTEEFVQDTEQVGRFRALGNTLWSPSFDPRCCADFAVRTTTSGWQQRDVANTYHVYDVAARAGNELFMSGSTTGACAASCGAVWRSTDGGASWALSLREDGAPGNPDRRGFRCFGMVGFRDRVHVQCSSGDYVFDGRSWSRTTTDIVHDDAAEFDGRLVTIRKQKAVSYDGATVQDLGVDASALAVDGGKLYAFANGRVYRTTDLDTERCSLLEKLLGRGCRQAPTWTTVGSYPASARSLEVLAGRVYVGDSRARVLRSTKSM